MAELIIGIDLGTTNSLVAISENGSPRILSADSEEMVSSTVYFPETDAPLVGRAAKEYRILESKKTAYSVKRFMGKGKQDLTPALSGLQDTSNSTNESVVLKFGTKTLTPVQVSALILQKLKSNAERALGTTVKKAVITVPAYFNDSQRTATKKAGELAGLEVVRIINEPTAASLAYGLDQKKSGLIAVYDLGGGTFDISILKVNDGIFEVLSTGGDTLLGGDDFDRCMLEIICQKLGFDVTNLEPKLNAELLSLAEELKIQLTSKTIAEKSISIHGSSTSISVTSSEFQTRTHGLVTRTLDIAEQALKDANLAVGSIDHVVMVGGSTRMPIIQKAVEKFFGKALDTSVNPDHVVALGAAIQAGILMGQNQDVLLLDIVPLSLGIETYGGTISKIVHRNSKIPTMAQETFTTHVDGQRNVLIHVLQGEREMVRDCRSLAKFDLRGLPALPAGLPKIEVTFSIDANGILTVSAQEVSTGKSAQVEVQSTYGLTDEKVETLLQESFDHAESDIQERQIVDTQVQAEGVIKSAEKVINQAKALESSEEHGALLKESLPQFTSHVAKVRDLMKGKDYVSLQKELDSLEEAAKPILTMVMNSALQGRVKNKNVSDFKNK